MNPTQHAVRAALAALALAVLAPTGAALADGKHYTADNPRWRSECGSCHVAYPPALLPASSWQAIMKGLDKHFGTDAGLDPKTAAEVSAFLDQNAGRDRKAAEGATLLRISETRWFRREHGEELPADVWKRKSIGSPANCAACHRKAEAGDYSERTLEVPK